MNARQSTQTQTISRDHTMTILFAGLLLLATLFFVLVPAAQATTWYAGGSYTVALTSGANARGSGHDSLVADSDGLDITSSSHRYFTVELTTNGSDLAGFDPAQAYRWRLVSTPGAIISGFRSNNIRLDTSGFTNDLAGGSFSLQLAEDMMSIDIMFTPAQMPEFLSAPVMSGGVTSIVSGSKQSITWTMDQVVKQGHFDIIANSADGEHTYLIKKVNAQGKVSYKVNNWKIKLAAGSGWYLTVNYTDRSHNTNSSPSGDVFEVVSARHAR